MIQPPLVSIFITLNIQRQWRHVATLRKTQLLPPFANVRLNFNNLDIQS